MSTSPTPAAAGHRPDIDGLRAIAVTSVVAYHVDAGVISGGFVGVDVFYVISGFLITGLLLRELQATGTLNFVNFYARRIRRLWPAYSVVALSTMLLGLYYLTPLGEQQQLAKSVIASLAFVSNIYFMLSTGNYFDQAAELAPLLHTWSLSVEEQFYLICPALLLATWAAARRSGWSSNRTVAGVLAALLLLSFAGCVIASYGARERAFYLMQFRAWELSAGGLLAMAVPALRNLSHVTSRGLTWLGLVALGIALFGLNTSSVFPGFWALLPVSGTALIIAGGSARNGSASRGFLSSVPLVAIGKVSYSWYLWHWPLLALWRAADMSMQDPIRDALAGGVSLLLAFATYRWVEQPIRDRKPGWFARPVTTVAAGAMMSICVAASAGALGLYARNQLSSQPAYAELWRAKGDSWEAGAHCHQDGAFRGLSDIPKCSFGSPTAQPSLVVWGDSHADQLMPLFASHAASHEISVLQRTRSACPPLIDAHILRLLDGRIDEDCVRFNQAVLEEIQILARQGPVGVVLAGRWTVYVNPTLIAGGPSTHRLVETSAHDTQATPIQSFASSLATTVAALSEAGTRTLVIGAIPELPYAAPECLARRTNNQCSTSVAREREFRSEIESILLHEATLSPALLLWDPLPAVCDSERCQPLQNAEVVYRDTNHLTASFTARLRAGLTADLEWLIR
ncbi:MAG: acyltransferase family protein [Steroidobacteraceae bacterium]